MTNNSYILIVDDKQKVQDSLALSLNGRGFKTQKASTLEEGWKKIQMEKIQLALVDVCLGDENGLDLLLKIQDHQLSIPVIMFTGYGTIETAIEAIKLGAFNYLQKPVKIEQLVASINTALKMYSLEEENKKLQDQIDEEETLIIDDPSMIDLRHRTIKLASTELPILIQGESGTGKEMFADLLHKHSNRRDCPMIKVNCAALPDALLDDELFGHEKGAFTGASNGFKGVFERAHGGTLFLDELGDMSLSTQAKILRAIQNNEVKRIGSDKIIKVDVRFIAATNKDLDALIAGKKFREDLYYRLNTAILQIPPVRERRNEVLLLAKHFLSRCKNNSKTAFSLSPQTVDFLLRYDWPGNVRELKSTIQYAAAIAGSSVIEIDDLPRKITHSLKQGTRGNLHQEMEEELICKTLKECDNNKKQAAALLGISRATLYNKLREYQI
ncbi:sigma-54-dependent Fis family transcriptional regulator [Oceanispirochaeta crateris]|uniref:Sigma-54-dependent Fis family transcriptional regulator n=1 Tax=Oceanispirochaeta crateris TaxID=2518645 RepID=A0A5C1QTZ6_9SPIO|nr:sigma-54 dependent transcriptional regulator [Oceanispirochaeta crateris]QEN09512.1 sigma-54-dependent Fis family transcriptional regulator [Oceanispirochaeta crateris]